MKEILYEDNDFYITKCEEFLNVPGFFVINLKKDKWYLDSSLMLHLAKIEKTIRDELMRLNIALTGIYKEEDVNGNLRVLIIPYDVKVLENNKISLDLYQPYIREYLDIFKENDGDLDKKILQKLEELKSE